MSSNKSGYWKGVASRLASLGKMALNLAGILFLVLRPFGEKTSAIVAIVCFAGAAVFFFVRIILCCRSYGSQTAGVTKSIWQEKSIHIGIEVGEAYIPALKRVPRILQLIDFFVGYFWKRLVLFAGIVATYTVVVFWIIRPILIHRYW